MFISRSSVEKIISDMHDMWSAIYQQECITNPAHTLDMMALRRDIKAIADYLNIEPKTKYVNGPNNTKIAKTTLVKRKGKK
mgnify:CR=1 FL=1